MTRRRLVNLGIGYFDCSEPFKVDRYRFVPRIDLAKRTKTAFSSKDGSRLFRRHSTNAFVEYEGSQEETILFHGSYVTEAPTGRKLYSIGLLEDILLLGSILTGRNWALYSTRERPDFPVLAKNRLIAVVNDEQELKAGLENLLCRLRNEVWLKQFSRGFQMKMLYNNSNIRILEARFLAQMVVWEFLCARLKGKENNNLGEIIQIVLEEYWPGEVNASVFRSGKGKNILAVLRNQLAHSGLLPIDRPYAEDWMRAVPVDEYREGHQVGLVKYFIFFDHLTQVVVMRSVGMKVEDRLGCFNFREHLRMFLDTGRL